MEQNKSLIQTAQANSQTFSLANQKIAAEIASFGSGYQVEVFEKYSKPVGIEKAVMANAPTFHDITKNYGENATLFWLRYHIAATFNFLGIYDQSSKYQVRETAELILQHEIFGQLTLSEFLNFLQRFKQGRYGKIYSSNHPNPQEFLQCLQPFWNELSYQRGKQRENERLEEISRLKKDGQHITFKEWLAEKQAKGEKVNNVINPLTRTI